MFKRPLVSATLVIQSNLLIQTVEASGVISVQSFSRRPWFFPWQSWVYAIHNWLTWPDVTSLTKLIRLKTTMFSIKKRRLHGFKRVFSASVTQEKRMNFKWISKFDSQHSSFSQRQSIAEDILSAYIKVVLTVSRPLDCRNDVEICIYDDSSWVSYDSCPSSNGLINSSMARQLSSWEQLFFHWCSYQDYGAYIEHRPVMWRCSHKVDPRTYVGEFRPLRAMCQIDHSK